jgi:hypothetical protein
MLRDCHVGSPFMCCSGSVASESSSSSSCGRQHDHGALRTLRKGAKVIWGNSSWTEEKLSGYVPRRIVKDTGQFWGKGKLSIFAGCWSRSRFISICGNAPNCPRKPDMAPSGADQLVLRFCLSSMQQVIGQTVHLIESIFDPIGIVVLGAQFACQNEKFHIDLQAGARKFLHGQRTFCARDRTPGL